MPNRKLSITQGLLEQVPEALREPWDRAMATWWVNLRSEGGMRLTRHGYEILREVLDLESWSFDLAEPNQSTGAWRARLTKRMILDLDRKLEWPYYLDFDPRKKRARIVFFGSQEAMMASLYGDLEQWLVKIESKDRHDSD
jgi:hypothetical protein